MQTNYLRIRWTDFKLSQDPLDGFSRSLYQMIGIALIMTDLDLFFDSPRDVAIPTDFMAKFRYMHSFGRAAFENGLQYRHSDSKIFSDNICKNDENRSSNPRDYEGNKCTFLDETANIGLHHQISHQLQDRSSPTFQHW